MARRTDPTRPVVAGVAISHPDRVVYPDVAATKLDVARYYDQVARRMLPHVVDRPLTLVRCGEGLKTGDSQADCFFMKHSKLWAPAALRRVRIQEKNKLGEYLIADSAAALVGLVQMGVLEVHTWNSCFAHIEQPDRVVIDIDPGPRVGWPAVVAAARDVRSVLEALDLQSFVKTTGGRGLHVVVPLTPRADWSECLDFARALAECLARRDPARYTTSFAKAGRDDKLLIDYLRNNRTNTSIAAYSTRAKPHASVSMPLAWSDLARVTTPDRFTMRSLSAEFAKRRSDPWKAYWTTKQTIRSSAVAALERL